MDVNHTTGVYNLNNPSLAWGLQFNNIFPDETPEWAMYTIYPVQWTSDERYLYLKVYPCCIDGPCLDYYSGIALIRLDLQTGTVSKILPLGDNEEFYQFTLSPDSTHLAYLLTWLKYPNLNMVNLVTGEEQHIALGEKYDEVFDVIWSPDFTQVVFAARTGEVCENMTHYLVMVDLDNFDQKVLLESTTEEYSPVEWTEDNHIIVSLGYEQGYGLFDFTTSEITPYLTPTPTGNP
jgi:Tol biopolymer transport system component